MKKIFLLALILVLAAFGACAAQTDSDMTAAQTQSPKPAASPTAAPRVTFAPWSHAADEIPDICISWVMYETLADLCASSPNIAVATVDDIAVDVVRHELTTQDGVSFDETQVTYTVTVDQPIKGGYAPGDSALILQQAWRYGDVNIYHPDTPPLAHGKTYLMFFGSAFLAPFESYPEIADDVLHPHARSQLFEDGMSADDAVAMVAEEVARQDAPGGVSAADGIDSLTAAAAFAPDQTPLRSLTDDEIRAVYDFSNDDFVLETAGKALDNGDIFIWVKTDKLTDAQQDDFYAVLDAAAKSVADGAHYKVTCTAFHSMISVCRYNEDNATIHDAFSKVIAQAMTY